jgi:hypothetical protein
MVDAPAIDRDHRGVVLTGWIVARLRSPILDQTTMPESRVEALPANARAGSWSSVLRLARRPVPVIEGAPGGSSQERRAIGREQGTANPWRSPT